MKTKEYRTVAGDTQEKTMDMKIDQARIEQAIIDRAVDEILGGDGQLDSSIYREVQKRVNEALSKTLNAKVERALDTAMTAALDDEVKPVNIWGESVGTPTTLRAALHERAKNFWNEKVDKEGKQTSSYGGKPRWEHIISIMTVKEFENAIKQDIVNIAAAIKDSMRSSFYAEVDAKLNEFFKVRSAEDQKRKK